MRNGQANLKREISCIKKLKHENIIQLYDVIDVEDYDYVYIVFELANFKSIRTLPPRRPPRPPPDHPLKR